MSCMDTHDQVVYVLELMRGNTASAERELVASALRLALQDPAAPSSGLRLVNTKVTGDLDLRHLSLPTLEFVDCHFSGTVDASYSTLEGVTFTGCDVADDLILRCSDLQGSLAIENLVVGGSLNLEGATINGRCDVFGVTVSGGITADKMSISSYMGWGKLNAESLSFNSCHVASPFADESGCFLRWSDVGFVQVCESTFTGPAVIGCDLSTPTEDVAAGTAIFTLEGSIFERDLTLSGFLCNFNGARRVVPRREFRAARAAGFVPCPNSGEDPCLMALRDLDMRRVRVAGRFYLPSREAVPGGLDLTDAEIGTFVFELPKGASEPADAIRAAAPVTLTRRWTVDAFSARSAMWREVPLLGNSDHPQAFEALMKWLPAGVSGDRFSVPPWRTAARALEAQGHEEEATDLRVESYDRFLRSRGGLFRQIWRRISRVTIGHGYRPTRSLWGILLIYLATGLLVTAGSSTFATTDGSSGKPGFWGFLYALDVIAPPIGSGQSTMWVTTVWWMTSLLWLLKLLAAGLVALFVSGLAGWTHRAQQ